MQAIAQDRYGSTDVLELRDIDRPEVGPREVLVRVHAAGVDRGVWHVMTGLPYPIRLAGYGVRAPRNPVPGTDVAGVVEAVGAEISRFSVGDEVFGTGKGSYAEYVRAAEDQLAPKPRSLTFAQAAAVPVSAITALQAVRDHARVQPGQRVLVLGASGGVGIYAVQLAKAAGARVTGVCSTGKVDLVRSVGGDEVIDYTSSDFAASAVPFDAILDIGGNSPLSRLRRVLAPTGTLVIVGGEAPGRILGGNDRQIRALVLSMFVGQTLRTFVASTNGDDLAELTRLIEAGQLRPIVDRSYPLAEVGKAIRHVERGRARGKVVITVAADAQAAR